MCVRKLALKFAHLNSCSVLWRGGALLGALLVVAVDQLTKVWALGLDFPQQVIPGLLNFHLAFNRGVSFSFLRDIPLETLPLILGGGAFAVSAVFACWLFMHPVRAFFVAGLGFLIGGAVGNGIDRFLYGAVVDFIDVYQGTWHFPTFNVADIAINIGVACLLLDAILEYKDGKKQRT